MNSNPETVSTDYDTCDRLYLEPVTLERVLDVVALEQPLGVVVSLGGQTPLGLAAEPRRGGRAAARRPARPRSRRPRTAAASARSSTSSALRAPAWGHVETTAEARELADELGYPVLVRPSYVLGGRGMRVARRQEELRARRPGARRPLPRRRARARRRRPLRRRATAGSRRSSSTSSAPASTPATRRASSPLRRSARRWRRRCAQHRAARSRAGSARAGCSTSSWRCTRASCTCSRRTRARRALFRSSPRRPGIPLVDHACRLLLGASLGRARAAGARRARRGPGRRRRSSRPSGSPAPPTAASRCARRAR